MKITVIAVGKLKEKYLRDGISEYAKRLSRFCDFEIAEVADEKAPENLSAALEAQVMKKEAERISKKIPDGSKLIVLDINGKRMNSVAFAGKIENFFNSGVSHITFVIGGSLGIDKELLGKADLQLSLSDMTFTHKLTRLILSEQVYRAFKIINGETYHK
ncbi:MAG: 23S rRNA (pseudouridine(1915)-N(3))-methyltransferase RlmH [Clostridia bacterium]|jgi:23S rRNA (pseudouridine1915-N3)-methyltransferase